MTNPQTAEDFAQRCRIHLEDGVYQQALSDCNKAISLDASLYKAYFNRSAVRNRLGDKQRGKADYWEGRRVMMESNKKTAQPIYNSRNTED